MDRKIDFLIIGAQKSGTTTVYEWLRSHPKVFLPSGKETIFFSDREKFREGRSAFDELYLSAHANKITGAFDIQSIFFPESAKRVHAYRDDMRIIAIFRNPIDRAYSAYRFARQIGADDSETFEIALEKSKYYATHGTRKQLEILTYLEHGEYFNGLMDFIKIFGKENVLVLFTEDMAKDPKQVAQQVYSFLSLCSDEVESIDFSRKYNVGGEPRCLWFYKVIRNDDSMLKRIAKNILPHRSSNAIRDILYNKLFYQMTKSTKHQPMRADTRCYLRKYYQPWNIKLNEELGFDVSRWN